jgi:3-oxoacyl-[acyl-carrier-protein] synthase-3
MPSPCFLMEGSRLFATIRAIDYYLPARTVTNADLVRQFPAWAAETVESKTGIRTRHIAAENELASDLAVEAARKLFRSGACAPSDIDYILLCTQSPDYLIPTTACLVQQRLGVPNSAGALDFNLGCSGFVYGLSLAKGLVETGEARNVLLLTCETYSKHMDPGDVNVRSIFGDAAAATLIQTRPDGPGGGLPWIGPFVYGTDGSGESTLIVRRGSLRDGASGAANAESRADQPAALFMDGPAIFSFTLNAVPDSVHKLLAKARIGLDDVDLFVFHQANRFMLEHLRRKLQIPSEKFVYAMEDCGNTVSSTIPIALCRALQEGRIRPGSRLMLVGFGVGYSWCAAMVRWSHGSASAPLAGNST